MRSNYIHTTSLENFPFSVCVPTIIPYRPDLQVHALNNLSLRYYYRLVLYSMTVCFCHQPLMILNDFLVSAETKRCSFVSQKLLPVVLPVVCVCVCSRTV